MVTPVERRNFVSVVRAAKKSKLGPIFFQNIRVIYKLSMKKQKTGQKTEKKPPKKVFFQPLRPAGSVWLDMVRPYPASGWIWSGHIQPEAGHGLDHIQPGWIWSDALMQAANFDNWNPFILCACILALFTAGVFILGSRKVTINNYDVVFGEGQGQPDRKGGGGAESEKN